MMHGGQGQARADRDKHERYRSGGERNGSPAQHPRANCLRAGRLQWRQRSRSPIRPHRFPTLAAAPYPALARALRLTQCGRQLLRIRWPTCIGKYSIEPWLPRRSEQGPRRPDSVALNRSVPERRIHHFLRCSPPRRRPAPDLTPEGFPPNCVDRLVCRSPAVRINEICHGSL